MLVIKGRGLVQGKAKGSIIKIERPISPLGDIDPEDGTLIMEDEKISLKKKILFIPYTVGSTVGAYILYRLSKKSLAPVAIVAEKADITLISACVISRIPLVDQINLKDIKGKIAEVDGGEGKIRIY